MTKILDLIADWLGENWGWIALVGVFMDISPIKFSPITGLLRWIGRKNRPHACSMRSREDSIYAKGIVYR